MKNTLFYMQFDTFKAIKVHLNPTKVSLIEITELDIVIVSAQLSITDTMHF